MSIYSENFKIYALKGYSVIPTLNASKQPAISSWTDYCQSLPKEFEMQLWADLPANHGIGLATGQASKVVVFDLDLRMDSKNPTEAKIAAEISEILPYTPVVKFGNKGSSRFYRYSGEKSQTIKMKNIHIGDILAGGRQSILPPSLHPETGEPYKWVGDKALYEINSTELPGIDLDRLLNDIKAILRKYDKVVPFNEISEARNDSLKNQTVAAIAKGKADETIARELIDFDRRKHNSPLFEDSTDPQMIGHTVEENALRFVERIRKSVSAIVPSDSKLAMFPFKQLFNEPFEETPFIVEGLLPSSGLSILVGKPKSGKSTLSRQLCLAVCKGDTFLDRHTKKGPVLYLALEEKRHEITKHFKEMGANEDIDLWITTELPEKNRIEALTEEIEKRRPSLVVIDTVFRFVKIDDGNNYNKVIAALEPICRLARNCNAHVLLIHHRGKGERTGGDAILGSTAIFGSIDTAIYVENKDGQRSLKSDQRYGTGLEEVQLIFDPITRTLNLGESTKSKNDELVAAQIINLLHRSAGPLDEESITNELKGSTGKLREVLRKLVESSRIKRSGLGRKGNKYFYSCGENFDRDSPTNGGVHE